MIQRLSTRVRGALDDLFEAPKGCIFTWPGLLKGPLSLSGSKAQLKLFVCLFFSISPLAFYILNAYFVLCKFRIIIMLKITPVWQK